MRLAKHRRAPHRTDFEVNPVTGGHFELSPIPPSQTYYWVRWEVENFYRTAKQCLGWGDYQVRDLQAMQTHVLLMMVTYTLSGITTSSHARFS